MNKLASLSCLLLCTALLLLSPATAGAGTIEELNIEDGRTDDHRLPTPVFDDEGIGRIVVAEFEDEIEVGELVVRRLARRVPQYDVAPAVDLGRIFSSLVRSEGGNMGLTLRRSGDGDWQVAGTIEELYLETVPIPFGPILFYCYMEVAIEVKQGDAAPVRRTYRLHDMTARYNAGFGAKDEAQEALSQFLIESSQELVALLNRDFFHAPPHPGVLGLAERLTTVDDNEAIIRAIGLSGAPEALPVLLDLLRSEEDVQDRVDLIDALATLGQREAVPVLASRFDDEDEDCRYFSLKAFDYIEGDEPSEQAARVIERARRDEDRGVKSLANRLP